MDDALALETKEIKSGLHTTVLILVVMDDALAQGILYLPYYVE